MLITEATSCAPRSPASGVRLARRVLYGVKYFFAVASSGKPKPMSHFLRHLRYGFRGLLQSPSVALIAVGSLALGIGATATIFTLVNALLLRPLPVEDAGRLVRIGRIVDGEGFLGFSHAEYQDLVRDSRTLEKIAGFMPNNLILRVGDEAREEWMELVTADYFAAVGVRLVHGRGFTAASDREPVPEIVIGSDLWHRRFGADPGVLGQVVRLNGHPVTVVGVAPPTFSGSLAGFGIGLWVPTGLMPIALPGEPSLGARDHRPLMLIGRLGDNVTSIQVETELRALVSRWPPTRDRVGITVVDATGTHPMVRQIAIPFLALLMAIVTLVLIVACVNVALLLLARGAIRQREMAIRQSLGATRSHLIQQLLAESILLAIAGGAGGLLLTFWLSRLLTAARPAVGIPIRIDVSTDVRVLAFTALVALGTTLLFGMLPALRTSRGDLSSLTKSGGPGGSPGRLLRGLVVVQVTLSTILLVGAALLIRSLINSRVLDPGFDASRTLVISPEPGRLGYDETRTRALWNDATERLRMLPGVERVTLALMTPLGPRADQMSAEPAERVGEAERRRTYDYNYVSEGYFAALRIPLVQGRDFNERDRAGSPDVAILTQAMAELFWPGESPLGRRIKLFDRENNAREIEVVGVARNSKYRSFSEAPRPVVYLPATQWYRADMRLQITTVGDPAGIQPAARSVLREIDPDLPATISTLREELAFSLIPAKLAGGILVAAGGIGLFLAAMGLFGIVSYHVARQAREIGIRMALGARSGQVAGMVVRKGVRLTATGLVIGLAAGAAFAQLLRGLLFGIAPTDPLSFGVIAGILLATGVAACSIPASRASRVDPMVVLREE